MSSMNRMIVSCCLFWLSVSGAASAQPVQKNAPRRNAPGPTVVVQQARALTYEESVARGKGAFLSGAGWYNLRTAQANSVNVDAVIRWKADIRKIQSDRRALDDQKTYEKIKNREEVKREIAKRELELRTTPTSNDVLSGAALNALVYDLTDPDLDSSRWRSVSSVPLPAGTSVKALLFSFTPPGVSTQAAAALSRGVIGFSRLEIKGNWHHLLMKDELSRERKAYEDAYLRVKEKVLRGDYAVDEILALDSALNVLKEKITTEIPNVKGYQTEARQFVNDIQDATRMFDAKSLEYAREILIDTQDHDATTVEELVAFMVKYRLQFATSQRSPKASELYTQIYERLRQQMVALGVKPGIPATANPDPASGGTWTSLFNGRDLSGWFVESGPADRWKIQNGNLMARGEAPRTFLLTDREFSDFVLRLEFSLEAKATTGVALRAIRGEKPPGPKGKGKGEGIIRHPTFLMASGFDRATTGSLRFLVESGIDEPDKKAVLQPPGQWNRLEIEMRGSNLRAVVNDNVVRNVTLPSGAKLPGGATSGLARSKGRIGLESDQGNIRFRNIEILELGTAK